MEPLFIVVVCSFGRADSKQYSFSHTRISFLVVDTVFQRNVPSCSLLVVSIEGNPSLSQPAAMRLDSSNSSSGSGVSGPIVVADADDGSPLLDIIVVFVSTATSSSSQRSFRTSKEQHSILYRNGEHGGKRDRISMGMHASEKGAASFFSSFVFSFIFMKKVSHPTFSSNLFNLNQQPKQRALAPDAPPDWTLDQIAGLVFGVR